MAARPEPVAAAHVVFDAFDDLSLDTMITMVAIAGAESGWNPEAGGDTPAILRDLGFETSANVSLTYNCPSGSETGAASIGLWQIFMPVHAQVRIDPAIGIVAGNLTPSTNTILGRAGAPIGNPCETAAWLRNPLNNARAARAIFDSQGLGAWSVFNAGLHTQFVPEATEAVNEVLQQITEPPPDLPPPPPLPLAQRRAFGVVAVGVLIAGGLLFLASPRR